MRFATFTFLVCVGIAASGCVQRQAHRISSADELTAFVGKRVELVCVVSNAAAPQILGVDLWGMEKLAGQRVRVSGILQSTVITRTGLDTSRAVDSGRDDFVQPVFRGPGTYYRLQELSYVSEM